VRLYARLWLVAAVLVAALGVTETVLVVPPTEALVTGVAVAALTCLAHVSWVARDGSSRARGRSAALVAGVAGLVGSNTTGLVALLGLRAVVLVVLVVCSHPRVLLAAVRQGCRLLHLSDVVPPPGAAGRRAAPGATPVPRSGSTRERNRAPKGVADLPTEQRGPDLAEARGLTLPELCWAWRASFTALDRADPRTEYRRWSALVAVRRCYLDELARRDPAGFARWLYTGARPASDPSRYVLAVPARRPLGRRGAA
jgi:hypothetical protein